MTGTSADDSRLLTLPERVAICRLLKRAGRRVRISGADELRVLEALARGEKAEAEVIRREVLAASLARALDQVLREHGL